MDATDARLILLIAQRVLPQFNLPDAEVRPLGAGLINQTFLVNHGTQAFVLQRVNPIFPPAVHQNIAAVTECLADAGLTTPKLVATREGELCLNLGDAGVWRLMTYVQGASFDVVVSPEQAHSAGALVGRFHAALQNLSHTFVDIRTGVHDTPTHLTRLRSAIEDHRGHRLHAKVAALAHEILAAAATLGRLPILEPQICHGDLKFSNVVFAGPDAPQRDSALCLIDLDTVGPNLLAYELGDAWRSWCNRAGEDSADAQLDLAVFRSSLRGYREGLGRELSSNEKLALLGGPAWVSLELAARFAADALYESYFGWDRRRFAKAGEHNLLRARGQLSLYRAFIDTRSVREEMFMPRSGDFAPG